MNIDGEDEDELLLDTPIEEPGEDEHAPPEEDNAFDLVIDGEDIVEETPLQKKLRDQLIDAKRENKELRSRIDQPKPADAGPEPQWGEGDSWDFDGAKFASAHREWERKREQVEQAVSQQARTAEARTKSFERVQTEHKARGAALKAADFEDCENAVAAVLGAELLGAALVMTGANSAKLTLAIGRNPALLAKLDEETDPLRKLAMIKDWEHKMKPKSNLPPPMESKMSRGSAPLAGSVQDKQAEKLLEAASKDPTKFKAYRDFMKSKSKG